MKQHLLQGMALFGLASASLLANAQTALPVGGSVQLNVPAASFSNDLYIDVPEGAQRLTVRLAPGDINQDLDLLVRYESAFPNTALDGRPPEAAWLFDHAQYQSTGPNGSESIAITPASRQPLRSGRLYLSIVSFASTSAATTVSATLSGSEDYIPITVLFDDLGSGNNTCDVSGWNDASARTPIRGNTGTTLGQQRRLALQESARLLSAELRPAVPIFVRGCWASLPFTDTSGTLAQAGPTGFFLGDVFDNNSGVLQSGLRALHKQYTIYSRAAAAHQSGTMACTFAGGSCTGPDVNIQFNLAVDSASQNNRRFDYGLEQAGSTGSSFVSTAMHELAHGLGFLGLINLNASNGAIGARLSEFDDIYGSQTVILPDLGITTTPFLRATVEQRADALVSSNKLRFTGNNAIASTANTFNAFPPPDNFIALHTPNQIAGGSTYSHLGTLYFGEMMLAAISPTAPRSLGLGRDLMWDLGWDPNPAAVPNAMARDSQYFDPARNGHGIDLRRVAGTTDLYFMVYYSYDASGNPEWFTSLGRVVDGLFLPSRNEFGDSLFRNLFRPGQTPQTIADSSPDFSGQVRVDFDSAAAAPACQASSELRSSAEQNVMTWRLGDGGETWCMEPLTSGREGVEVDFSGIWFDPQDPGWGITFLSFPGNGGDGLGAQIYYPDATGRGRWAVIQTDRYVPGESYPVLQVSNGYCRECPSPNGLNFTQVGTMTVNLSAENGGQASTVSFDITYPGSEGGQFTRSNANIVPGSEPEF